MLKACRHFVAILLKLQHVGRQLSKRRSILWSVYQSYRLDDHFSFILSVSLNIFTFSCSPNSGIVSIRLRPGNSWMVCWEVNWMAFEWVLVWLILWILDKFEIRFIVSVMTSFLLKKLSIKTLDHSKIRKENTWIIFHLIFNFLRDI